MISSTIIYKKDIPRGIDNVSTPRGFVVSSVIRRLLQVIQRKKNEKYKKMI